MWKHIRGLIAPVVASLLVVGVANSAMYQWSKTPASNATADATINWSEGQSPSSINDSARSLMARVAEWRDDISGSLTGAGTSTAYTVTTNQGIATPTPTTGQMIAFVPGTTNGTGVTLAVDGGTAYPIRSDTSTAVSAGTLVAGTPYTMTFNGTYWLLRDFYVNSALSGYLVPIGAVLPYTGTSAPNSNFVLANGQAISRTTYAAYFAIVSTTFGAGDGTTTFNVPNLSGRVVAGLDNMSGSSANILTSTYYGTATTAMGAQGGTQSVTLTEAQLPVMSKAVPAQQPTFTYGTTLTNFTGAGSPPSGISALTIAGSGQANSVTTAAAASPGSISIGSGNAHATIQPTMLMNMIIRVQ